MPLLRKVFYCLAVAQFAMFGALKVRGHVATWAVAAALFGAELSVIAAYHRRRQRSAVVADMPPLAPPAATGGASQLVGRWGRSSESKRAALPGAASLVRSPAQASRNVALRRAMSTAAGAHSGGGGGGYDATASEGRVAASVVGPPLPETFFKAGAVISDADFAKLQEFRREYRGWRLRGAKGAHGEVGSCVTPQTPQSPQIVPPETSSESESPLVCVFCRQPLRHGSLASAHAKHLQLCPLCRANVRSLNPLHRKLDLGPLSAANLPEAAVVGV